jgi:hypothetical protein
MKRTRRRRRWSRWRRRKKKIGTTHWRTFSLWSRHPMSKDLSFDKKDKEFTKIPGISAN